MPKIGADRRDARRRQIIDGARRGLEHKSYSDLTVDDICSAASLSKGAFYLHFESKQALLAALIDDDAAALGALIIDLEASHRPALDKIRRLLRALLERGADAGHAQARADALGVMLTDPDVRAQFNDSVRRARTRLARWIDDAVAAGELTAVPSNALAAMLLALADGLMLYHASDPSGFRWANIGRAVDVLLDGISQPATIET